MHCTRLLDQFSHIFAYFILLFILGFKAFTSLSPSHSHRVAACGEIPVLVGQHGDDAARQPERVCGDEAIEARRWSARGWTEIFWDLPQRTGGGGTYPWVVERVQGGLVRE